MITRLPARYHDLNMTHLCGTAGLAALEEFVKHDLQQVKANVGKEQLA